MALPITQTLQRSTLKEKSNQPACRQTGKFKHGMIAPRIRAGQRLHTA
jgi:hypothetical protein